MPSPSSPKTVISITSTMRYPLAPRAYRVLADFNGTFGDLLRLSHGPTSSRESGEEVVLSSGMVLTAYTDDLDERDQRDDLVATGVGEPSPDWLQCRGSIWSPRIDENGVRHESEI